LKKTLKFKTQAAKRKRKTRTKQTRSSEEEEEKEEGGREERNRLIIMLLNTFPKTEGERGEKKRTFTTHSHWKLLEIKR
jgi:hypothetical protein